MRALKSTLICLTLALVASAAFAQGVTTAAISGKVVDAEQTAMPGAQVTAVHEPTGTRYQTNTNAEGVYLFGAVRVGGPYQLTVEFPPYQSTSQGGIFVNLGGVANIPFTLQLEAIEETVTVVAEAGLINPNRTGSESSVSLEAIENLPTIGRGFDDFTRTNPFFTVTPNNSGSSTITVAGRNSRYNNIQIDGSVNNDLFGLADTGTPGGQTESTPISLDAIQEFQLVLAPFDVRQGGFSGGGVNAVTRSGSNDFSGSVFYFTRDDSNVGDGPDDFPELGTFSDDSYGFRIGGPFSKDKIFFFANGEIGTRETPTGFSIDGAEGINFANGRLLDDAQRFAGLLQSRYGYDPGSFAQQTRNTDSDKYFARLDFNLATSHQLTLRHNYVDAENLILRPDAGSYEFPGHAYLITDETNSTVAQLNSVFGSNSFNELRLARQTISDLRFGVDQPFPYVNIQNFNDQSGRLTNDFEAGTERFSTENSLDQEIFELTDDFTFIRGNHTITVGTHNEFFSFENLFVQESYGAYRFTDLESFDAGIANQYDLTFANGDPFARFDVTQLGFYAGDQWRVRDNLTLTYGLRVDAPLFPDEPARNPLVEQVYGFRTDEVPDGNYLFSPRIGFNWDVAGDGKQQLRGGVGIFAGRTPYVWLSNNYTGTGLEFTTIQARGNIPFVSDPFNQPRTLPGVRTTTQQVNIVDPDFEFPTVMRINLAWDQQLPWQDIVGTVELVHAESQNEIAYQNLNVVPTGQTLAFDGRPTFRVLDNRFAGAFLLTNSDEGKQTNLAVKLERPYRDNWSSFVSYVWGDSEVINDGTSSRAVSNWEFNEALDPNNPAPSRSDFEVEHRFSAGINYEIDWGTSGSYPTTISAFWNHQSGRPYSTIYNFATPSINGDNFGNNDLIYVPAGPNDVIITGGGTWEQLDAYISADEGLNAHRGEIAPRNVSIGPWTSQLDLRVAQDVTVFGSKVQLSLDVLNFWNLIDKDSGHVNFPNNNAIAPITFVGVDTATGKPIYSLDREITDPENTPRFTLDNLRSRWQAKLGVRWTF